MAVFMGLPLLLLSCHLKFQLDVGRKFFHHLGEGNGNLLVVVQRGADGCEKMGVLRGDGVLVVQLQRADESGFELGEEV